MYTLKETCCGSAALTLHLLGARQQVLPYQGSKWRYRRVLTGIIRRIGCSGVPRRVELYDPSPWGVTAGCIIDAKCRAGVIDRLRFMNRLDPKQVFLALHNHPVPKDDVKFATEYLFLQRIAFSGKAVGIRDGKWNSPGFNGSSAYGLPGTARFGYVLPMIPSLIRNLESYSNLIVPERLEKYRSNAPLPRSHCTESTIVYIDPPYQGSTPYPDGNLSREEVIILAHAWHDAGALVLVSEGEPLSTLIKDGWLEMKISKSKNDASPFRGKHEEWLTLSPSIRNAIE